MKKILSVLLTVSALSLGIASCQKKTVETAQEAAPQAAQEAAASSITVVFGSEPNTIDPALNSAVDAAIYAEHLFEGLYKYEDNGSGIAQAVPGLAASAPRKAPADGGEVVYTYTLRAGLKWSDGKPFTAQDIVYSWRRLVDPATAADYSYMITMVKNADEIMAGEKDKSELGIAALDDVTVEITLTYDCPFFDEIACFPATFPVRQDVIESAGDQWTFNPATYISNGPYRLKEWVHNSHLTIEKNPHYYEPATGPDLIRFALMDDDNALLAGFRNEELDYIQTVPVDEIQGLLDSGELKVVPYLGTYYVSFNTQKAPFNDARVRKAFNLAIDRAYIINQITRSGQQPASGFVPSGIADAAGAGSDFRQIGGDYYSIAPGDYEKNVAEAKRLLAEAGYPEGAGFPVAEYIYNTNDAHRAIAEALQDMWKTALGVNVTLSNQDWAVFLDTRKIGDFQIARDGWIGDYNDPMNFLEMYLTGGGNNNSQYASPAFDALIKQAQSTAVAEERMRLMHQAEDILVGQDAAVGPIYFYTQSYMMNPKITGMYYTPLGYFFFKNAQIAP
ncbi:MAG: peptide ABC transporter substrate-binding protein [Treponema sp.]|jgi:oligopeptide transport system substrate-binding protein|nr:peptide ABC transporter substrate-binding protein [Treponema sp.]